MLIVLEGVDGSGKSTIAEILAHALDAEVIHATRETPNDYKWFSDIINAAKYKNIIADRFFWGQFVYQDKEDRHIDETTLTLLENRLNALGGKIIYVQAAKSDICKRLWAREEQLSLPLSTLLNRYVKRIACCHCSVSIYDTTLNKFVNFEEVTV